MTQEQAQQAQPDITFRGAAARLMHCRDEEVLIEGPAGTGKTLACLAKCVHCCDSMPGVRVLVARATRASCTESILVTLERELIPSTHYSRIVNDVTRAGRKSYIFENGSELVIGGLDDTQKIMSAEYDLIYIPEATESTVEDWERCLTRLRNGKMGYHQSIADCNPGPPGHWLNERAAAGKMTRLRSRHHDNPSCTPEYLNKLANLTGHRRARLFEGRWVAASGAVFPMYDDERLVLPDFEPPDDWPMVLGYDPGWGCTGCIWVARAPDGGKYVIDEIYGGQQSMQEHCREITRRNRLYGRKVLQYFGDPNEMFSNRAQGPSCAYQAMQYGGDAIRFVPWPKEAGSAFDAGVERVREHIGNALALPDPVAPYLMICARCTGLRSNLQSWSYKVDKEGQLRGADRYEEGNDHCLAADTLVWTDRGRRAISDLLRTEGVAITPYGPARFYDVHRSGVGRVYRWTFSNGVQVDATDGHRIQLADGSWSQLACIRSTDLIPDPSRRVGIPQWTDPYGDGSPSQGRQHRSQRFVESRVIGRGGAPEIAWANADTRAPATDAGEHHPVCCSCGQGMAPQPRGEAMARRYGQENNRPAHDPQAVHLRDVRKAFDNRGPDMPTPSPVLLRSMQMAGQMEAVLVSKQYLYTGPVYDLSVEHWHCLIVNDGLVVSNSIDPLRGILSSRFLERDFS